VNADTFQGWRELGSDAHLVLYRAVRDALHECAYREGLGAEWVAGDRLCSEWMREMRAIEPAWEGVRA
jgi:hypothetical protein